MPETCGHHVLDGSSFAVGEFYFDFGARGNRVRAGFGRNARLARATRLLWLGGFGCDGFAVPFGVVEVFMGSHEIVDREVIFAFVEAGATADDLLELDHGINGTHQDDIADIASVNAGGEFLRGGENSGDGFFVVLEVAEELFADEAVVGGDAGAIVWVAAGFRLID